ncbi:MAG: ATP-binding protein [Actinomycetota bacterium]|nr:ATP-binding protein [Actinomycetota bacterium]
MPDIQEDAVVTETHGTEPERILRAVLERAMDVVQADSGALAVYTSSGALRDFVAVGGDSGEMPRPRGEPLPGPLRWSRDEEGTDEAHGLPVPAAARSLLGFPLPLTSGTGILNLYLARSGNDSSFSEQDEELLSGLAALASLAVGHARLLETERLRADAISVFVHELRSPLTVIAGIANLLKRPTGEITGDLRAELVEILGRESSRLTRLVSNVLDAETLRRQQGSIEAVRCDLVELAGEAALDAGGGDRVAVAAPAEPLTAPVDRDKIKQVLVNLVSNALKFAPDPTPITVSVRAEEERAGAPPWAEVAVQDFGPGIAAHDVPKLFHMFARVGNRDKPGSGLGLYASKLIIERHGGSMSVVSEPGRGSRFSFRLPRD